MSEFLALFEGQVLEFGKILIQLAERGGLKTAPLALPLKIPTDKDTAVKVKEGGPEDCRRVLRFCDATSCVERTLSDPLLTERIFGGVLIDLATGGTLFNRNHGTMQFIADEIYKCMKTELLGNQRAKVKTSRYRAFSRRTGGYAKEGLGVPPL